MGVVECLPPSHLTGMPPSCNGYLAVSISLRMRALNSTRMFVTLPMALFVER